METAAAPAVPAFNTFADPGYDRVVLLRRLDHRREIVLGRERSVEVARQLEAEGALVTWFEGPLLIARRSHRPPAAPPPRPFSGSVA